VAACAADHSPAAVPRAAAPASLPNPRRSMAAEHTSGTRWARTDQERGAV
jgi:hypothetical protein